MRQWVWRILLFGWVLPVVAWAEPSAEDILRRADAILAPERFVSELALQNYRDGKVHRSFSVKVWKKGGELHRIRFLSPEDDRGSEVLRSGEVMWNYLPNLKRAIRISPKQEFHGGDFSNADMLRPNLLMDYVPRLVPASQSGEWQLELTAKNDEVAYAKIVYAVRKSDNMPLRQEFFTSSGKAIRRLEFLEPKSFGKHARPTRLVMHNLLVPSRRTELRVRHFDVVKELDEGLFQLAALGR